MALILDNCRLLRTPKTGSTWMAFALKNAGCRFVKTEVPHLERNEAPGQGLFTIAFVRHPWAWWKSYWVYKRAGGWDFRNRFDLQCMDNEFERFMLNVLDHAPGRCSEVFRKFVGSADDRIEFVGAFENLVDDLVAGLRQAGAQFDEAGLRATGVRNASDYSAFSTKCSPEIQSRVLDAEREMLERFNYSADACSV